jgi:hypothetical protein
MYYLQNALARQGALRIALAIRNDLRSKSSNALKCNNIRYIIK